MTMERMSCPAREGPPPRLEQQMRPDAERLSTEHQLPGGTDRVSAISQRPPGRGTAGAKHVRWKTEHISQRSSRGDRKAVLASDPMPRDLLRRASSLAIGLVSNPHGHPCAALLRVTSRGRKPPSPDYPCSLKRLRRQFRFRKRKLDLRFLQRDIRPAAGNRVCPAFTIAVARLTDV